MKQAGSIFHICKPFEWIERTKDGFYFHPSLSQEGFIHFSRHEQLEATIERFFSGEKKLLILEVDTFQLVHPLKYELAESLNEHFPHLYGPLNIDAVMHVDARIVQ